MTDPKLDEADPSSESRRRNLRVRVGALSRRGIVTAQLPLSAKSLLNFLRQIFAFVHSIRLGKVAWLSLEKMSRAALR